MYLAQTLDQSASSGPGLTEQHSMRMISKQNDGPKNFSLYVDTAA
jgi:hypothetical protein